MTPIESEFRERLDGEVNAGFNFSKDSEILQTNFGIVADYVMDDCEINLAAESITSRDSANESSQRSSVSLSALRRSWISPLRLRSFQTSRSGGGYDPISI